MSQKPSTPLSSDIHSQNSIPQPEPETSSSSTKTTLQAVNPLGQLPVSKLLLNFSIPSIIAMLVGSLYNIVDQLFIGNSVGELGNAATNIMFPLNISCIALALLFGIGGAAAFNLAMGRNEIQKAASYLGNASVMLFGSGVLLMLLSLLFLRPLLVFFGSPAEVLPYAEVYTGICAFGFPWLILVTGGAHLIRADGRPQISMFCNLLGAVINTILDAIFIFVFNWGMAGAAWATVIGQVLSALLSFYFITHCRSIEMHRQHFRLKVESIGRVMSLGISACVNQISLMIVQIVMNRSLKHYGQLSVYGMVIPIAVVGIGTKVYQVFLSFLIGIAQGLQPISSFNYGAKKFSRVRQALRLALAASAAISVLAFVVFFFFARHILNAFGSGSELYMQFGQHFFRIFLFFTFLNWLQPLAGNFFPAIGKPQKGFWLSMSRQILFLLPLILLLPLAWGVEGVLYAGPIADLLAGVLAAWMLWRELRQPEYHPASQVKV